MTDRVDEIPLFQERPEWGLGMFLLGLATAVFAIVALYFGIRSTGKSALLLVKGEQAVGTVLATERLSDADGPSTTRLQYRFATQGGETVVSWSFESSTEYNSYGRGDEVPILYIPDAPGINGVDVARGTHLGLSVAALAMGLLLGLALVRGLLLHRREMRAFRALSESLVETSARLTGSGGHPTMLVGTTPAEVAIYEFLDESGSRPRVRSGVLTARERKRLCADQRIAIVYARHDPSTVHRG